MQNVQKTSNILIGEVELNKGKLTKLKVNGNGGKRSYKWKRLF